MATLMRRILDAVAAEAGQVALAGVTGIKVRSQLKVFDQTDTLPICIVARRGKPRPLRPVAFEGWRTWEFPIVVAVVGGGNGKTSAQDLDLWESWLENLVARLDADGELANVPEVCQVETEDAEDAGTALQEQGYAAVAALLTYTAVKQSGG